jgi:hypothetical protein
MPTAARLSRARHWSSAGLAVAAHHWPGRGGPRLGTTSTTRIAGCSTARPRAAGTTWSCRGARRRMTRRATTARRRPARTLCNSAALVG